MYDVKEQVESPSLPPHKTLISQDSVDTEDRVSGFVTVRGVNYPVVPLNAL
jgi:hypothetical protein